jgi:hypothetical protein
MTCTEDNPYAPDASRHPNDCNYCYLCANARYPNVIVYNDKEEIIEIKPYDWEEYRMYDEDNDTSFHSNHKFTFSDSNVLLDNKKLLIAMRISGTSHNDVNLLSEEYIFYKDDIVALIEKIKKLHGDGLISSKNDITECLGHIITYDKKVAFIHGYIRVYIEKLHNTPMELYYGNFINEIINGYTNYLAAKKSNRRKSI